MTNLLLSYSRAWTFMNDRKEFIERYVFNKVKPPTTAMMKGKKLHWLIQTIVPVNNSLTYNNDGVSMPLGKTIIPYYTDEYLPPQSKKRNKDLVYLDKSEYDLIYELIFNLQNISAFSDIKDIFEDLSVEMEKELVNEQMGIRGICDLYSPTHGIIELKCSEEYSFNRMKERYALQQVFYKHLLPDSKKFFFLLCPTTRPFDIKLAVIESRYLDLMNKHLINNIIPSYQDFIQTLLSFDKTIFETTPDRAKLYNFLYKEGLLSNIAFISPTRWEYSKLED